MKLRNKKTGEIAKLVGYVKANDRMFFRFEDDKGSYKKEYNSLAELNEEWEDYEESKNYFYLTAKGNIHNIEDLDDEGDEQRKAIGNYFETKEEAEQAVEKLRAFKRLKDKGFRFNGWKCTGSISFTFDNYCGDGQPMSASDYLDLLFGGNE